MQKKLKLIFFLFLQFLQIRDLRFSDLVLICKFLSGMRLNYWFEVILWSFDKKMKLNLKNSKKIFFGRGKGVNTLGVYRKIQIGGELFFEKIYKLDSMEYDNSFFFYDQYSKVFEEYQIYSPEIKKRLVGDKLVAVYYKFKILEKIEISYFFDRAYSISKRLISIGEASQLEVRKSDWEKLIFHNQFDENFAESFLRFCQFTKIGERRCILDRVNLSKKVLGHGDLHKTNIYEGDIVIDWDLFGWYPVGYEFGFILYRTLRYTGVCKLDLVIEDLKNEDNFQEIIFNTIFIYLLTFFYYDLHNIHWDLFQKILSKFKAILKESEF